MKPEQLLSSEMDPGQNTTPGNISDSVNQESSNRKGEQDEKHEKQMEEFLSQLLRVPLSSPEIAQLAIDIQKNGTLAKDQLITLKNLNCIRYVSRNHGLPKNLLDTLIAFLLQGEFECNERGIVTTNLSLKIAQVLKYCVRKDVCSIDQSQFLQLLNNCSKDDLAQGNPLAKAILNEIALALVAYVEKTVETRHPGAQSILHNGEIKSSLRDRIPYLHPNLRTKMTLELDASAMANNCDMEADENKFNNVENIGHPEEDIRLGADILKDISNNHIVTVGSSQCHAVKSQQAIVCNSKEFTSEKNSVQEINVISALSSQAHTETIQDTNMYRDIRSLTGSGLSQRWCLRATDEEVHNFFDIASKNREKNDLDKVIVCEDDVKWLCDTFSFDSWRLSLVMSTFGIVKNIAAIFAMISEYQDISDTVLESLAKVLFNKELPEKYNDCRRLIIRAIDNYSNRHRNIPEEIRKVLENFQDRRDECSPEIHADIWHVISKSQNVDLVRIFVAMCGIIEKGPENTDREKAIAFVRNEICSEQRCQLVDRQNEFYLTFIRFLTDTTSNGGIEDLEGQIVVRISSNDLSLKIDVAGMLEVYLAYSFAKSLEARHVDQLTEVISTPLIEIGNAGAGEAGEESNTVENEHVQSLLMQPLTYLMAAKHDEIHREKNVVYQELLKRSTRNTPSPKLNDVHNSFDEQVSRFKSSLIRSILHSVEKQRQVTSTISENYLKTFKILVPLCTSDTIPKDLQIVILSSLDTWLTSKSDMSLPSILNLAPQLLDRHLIHNDGRVELQSGSAPDPPISDSGSNIPDATCISAIVGNLLLKQFKFEHSSAKCHSVAITALKNLNTHPDKTTQIICSQLIFNCLVQEKDNEIVFEKAALAILRQTAFSSHVIDIKIYCTSAYCIGLRNWIKSRAGDSLQLESHEVDALAHMYEWDQLILDTEDHKEHINPSIREILKIVAERSQIEFSEDIFELLTRILTRETDIETVKQTLIILNSYSKEVEGNIRNIWLPYKCVEAVEKSYTLNDPDIQGLCEQILHSILLRGQELSEYVLGELMKSFVSLGTDSFAKYTLLFKLFYLANENQDVPDFVFQQLDMELTGIQIMSFFNSWKDSAFINLFAFLKDTGNSSVREFSGEFRENILENLHFYVRKGMHISLLNCAAVSHCIACPYFEFMAYRLLATAVENGQYIPKEIIVEAFERFLEKNELTLKRFKVITKFSITLLDKNQTLPTAFVKFCSDKFICPSEVVEVRNLMLRILVKVAENQHTFSFPITVVESMCEYFSKAPSHRYELLNALVRLTSQSSICSSFGTQFKQIFLLAIQNKDGQSSANDIEVSIQGLKFLLNNSEEDLSEGEMHVIASQRNNADLCDSVKEFVEKMISDAENFSVEYANSLQKFSDGTFLKSLRQSIIIGALPPAHYWLEKLNGILKNSTSNRCTNAALEIIASMDRIPSCLLDSVGFTFVNDQNLDIRSSSESIIRNALSRKQVDVDFEVSSSFIEYLDSASASRPDCEKILFLIYDNGLAPSRCSISETFDFERKINNLLVKLQSKGPTLNGDDRKHISELLSTCKKEIFKIGSRIVSNLMLLNVPTLKSIPGIEVFLSHYALEQVSNLNSTNIGTFGQIIEEALIACNSSLCGLTAPAIDSNGTETPANPVVYLAYQKILECTNYTSKEGLGPVVDSMTHMLVFFDRENLHRNFRADILIIVLRCIHEFIKLREFQASQILIQTLEKYVQNPVAHLRRLALKVLISWSSNSLDTMVKNMYKAIGRRDFDLNDKKFNSQILEILVTTSNWGLSSLATLDKREWAKHLLTTDYMATYGQGACGGDDDSKCKLLKLLQRLFGEGVPESEPRLPFGEEDAVQILLHITLKSNISHRSSVSEILSMLEDICQLESYQVMQVLERSSSEKFTTEFVEMTALVIEKMLRSKFSIVVCPEILQSISAKLISLVGSANAILLLNMLGESKTTVSTFNELITALQYFPCTIQAVSAQIAKDRDRNGQKLRTCEDLIQFFNLRYLLTYWPEDFEDIEKVETHLERLVSLEFPVDKIIKLFHVLKLMPDSVLTEAVNFTDCANILCQVVNYRVSISAFNKLIDNLSAHANRLVELQSQASVFEAIIEQGRISVVNRAIMNTKFPGGTGRKDADHILADFERSNTGLNYSLNLKDLKSSIQKISKGNATSRMCNLPPPLVFNSISGWNEQDIKLWSKKQLEQPSFLTSDTYILEVLMVARRAYVLWKGYNLTYVQIFSCLLALDENLNKCQLQQVVTGCGKSTIIAIVAVARALRGRKVDVYTSSPVLAERDAREWSSFYQMFSLTCDHNGDRGQAYLSGPKKCYQANIVYGDTSQFQFDTLRDEYSGLGTKGGREFEFALIDEVDCMLIDDSSKLARLSSSLPAMDSIQILYHLIWERLKDLGKHLLSIRNQVFYFEGQIQLRDGKALYAFTDTESNELRIVDDVVAFVDAGVGLQQARIHRVKNISSFTTQLLRRYAEALITNEDENTNTRVKIPKNLTEFVNAQIPKWVDSALNALVYQENVHYIIDEGKIKPVDYQTTGVVQSSTNWSHGLHQFLQLKHSLKITSETVTTNFLSNIAIFRKYGSNLVGLTGTLGAEFGRKVLSKVYNAQLYLIPENHFKSCYRLPDVFVGDADQWRKEVVYSALHEARKGRGVLIITKTIREAQLISGMLGKYKATVKLYTRNDANQENLVDRVLPGDIIVSTNLAGRGTDIQAAEINSSGGLHVILTFLPNSLRVEEQAFGRTSRQGQRGTGQLIAHCATYEYNRTAADNSGKILSKRKELEENYLTRYQEYELLVIQTKDRLFSRFCSFYREVRSLLMEKRGVYRRMPIIIQNALYGMHPVDPIVLQSLEELWATFLDKVDDGRIETSEVETEYRKFEAAVREKCRWIFESQQTSQEIVDLPCVSAFYYIQLGNLEYSADSRFNHRLTFARQYYDKAIEFDPKIAAAAYVGKSYVLLQGRVNVIASTGFEQDYKIKARELLCQGLELLANEMSMLTTMQTFLFNRNRGTAISECSDLHEQLVTKMNLLGTYVQSVEANEKVVTKSLRRVVYQEISDEGVKEGLVEKQSLVTSTSPLALYKLSFHDLTERFDIGVRDEVVETITRYGQLDNISLSFPYLEYLSKLRDLIPWTSHTFSCLLFRFDFDRLSLQAVKKAISRLGSFGFVDGYTLLPIFDENSPCSVSETRLEFHVENLPTIISQYESQGGSQSRLFKLTLSDITPALVIQLNEEVDDWKAFSKSVSGGWKVEMYNMNEKNLSAVVKKCRDAKIEIVLNISGLTRDAANTVLQNTQRKSENTLLRKTNTISALHRGKESPMVEILELQSRGIEFLNTFGERRLIPWRTVATIGIIGGVQLAVGTALVCSGFGATVGHTYNMEGVSDVFTSLNLTSTREFCWKQFVIQKGTSLALSAISLGYQAYTAGGRASVSRGEAVLYEGAEQTGARFFASRARATIKAAEAGLQSRWRQAMISTRKVCYRIGINTAVDVIAKFSFQLLREQIRNQVTRHWNVSFEQKELYPVFSRHYVLDKFHGTKDLKEKVRLLVRRLTNGKVSEFTKSCLKISSLLSSGARCRSESAGDLADLVAAVGNYLIQLNDFATIIRKVADEMDCKLNSRTELRRASPQYIIQHVCQVPVAIAKKCVGEEYIVLSKEASRNFHVTNYGALESLVGEEKCKEIENVFTKLHTLQANLSFSSCVDIIDVNQLIVDSITDHIITLADKELFSPLRYAKVGSLITHLCPEYDSQPDFLLKGWETTNQQDDVIPSRSSGAEIRAEVGSDSVADLVGKVPVTVQNVTNHGFVKAQYHLLF